MNWKGLLETVGGVAATALAIPTGGLSTAVWGIAKKITGIDGDDDESRNRAAEIIAADPKLQMEFSLQMRQVALKETQAYLADVSDARKREVAITRATGKKDYNLYILAWTVVIGFFGLIGILMFVDLPEDSAPVVNLLLGGIVSGFSTVLAYFFGSSKSSSDKTAILAQGKS